MPALVRFAVRGAFQVVLQADQGGGVRLVRGNGDMGLEHEHLHDRYTVEVDGARIAMIHDFPSPAYRPADVVLQRAEQRFPDAKPDVIVYGHTHIEEVHRLGDLLCVNPGSPTYPHNYDTQYGTIGFLDIDGDRADASVWLITDAGIEPFDWDAVPPWKPR